MKFKKLLYLLPYFSILLIGIWYRMHIPHIVFLDSDSGNYLLPAFIKKIAGEWHKGERPMPYLQFIYYTLSNNNQLSYTILLQHILSITGAGCLAAAWIVLVNHLKRPEFLLHMAGYFLLLLYVSSPQLMYYEQFIGPEAVSVALMCVLIFCITVIFSADCKSKFSYLVFPVTIFVNLYLWAFMTKWIFAALFLELILIYRLVKLPHITLKSKLMLLTIPHLFYFVLVTLPERQNKIDFAYEDRLYIEYRQMAYTHFNILIKHKSDFELPPALQDSLEQYFREAEETKSEFLTGFDSDVLMWGKASALIDNYFGENYIAIEKFFKNLNLKLAFRYPLELGRDILKQVAAFYIPNKWIHKEVYATWQYIAIDYNYAVEMAHRFDSDLILRLANLRYAKNNSLPSEEEVSSNYFQERYYPALTEEEQTYMAARFPKFHNELALFARWFDYLFITVFLLFFILKIYQKTFWQFDAVSVLHASLLVYVLTVSIVHTFDIGRFIFTIYPFLLMTAFMSCAYLCKNLWAVLAKK